VNEVNQSIFREGEHTWYVVFLWRVFHTVVEYYGIISDHFLLYFILATRNLCNIIHSLLKDF